MIRRLAHALYTLKRRLQGKPDYEFGSVPRGTIDELHGFPPAHGCAVPPDHPIRAVWNLDHPARKKPRLSAHADLDRDMERVNRILGRPEDGDVVKLYAKRPTVCDPSCGPMWTPGYCDDDCPNAPQEPTSWAAERAQVLAPSADK